MTDISIKMLDHVLIPEVVALVRSSFEQDKLSLMIYGQRGIERYIADQLPRQGVHATREYWVAIDNNTEEAVGFAEFDLRGARLAHLSYICVSPYAQGRRIATRLINRFIEVHSSLLQIQLDVFSSNIRARSLYTKLGFVELDAREWMRRKFPQQDRAPKISLPTLPTTLACLERHGFASFELEWEGKVVQVGLLGEIVARFQQFEAFRDDKLLRSIQRVFPRLNTALLIADIPSSTALGFDVEPVLTSIRMTRSLGPISIDGDSA